VNDQIPSRNEVKAKNFVPYGTRLNEILSNIGNHDGQKELQKPGYSSDKVLKSRNSQVFGGLRSGQ
jgi:hypothetical protein